MKFQLSEFHCICLCLYLFLLVIVFVMHIHIMCMWFICMTPKGFLQKFYLINSPYNKNSLTLYYASYKCFCTCYWSHKVSKFLCVTGKPYVWVLGRSIIVINWTISVSVHCKFSMSYHETVLLDMIQSQFSAVHIIKCFCIIFVI